MAPFLGFLLAIALALALPVAFALTLALERGTEREKETTSTLRMAISQLKKEEIDKRIDLEDEQVIQILQRMIKQRKDSYSQFLDAGRNELAEKEQNEISPFNWWRLLSKIDN